MNQREFDLYIELQPKLNEYRGSWEGMDDSYCLKYNCKYMDFPCIVCSAEKDHENCKHRIWLPLPIDPADPERIARGEKPRGLQGMLDSYKTEVHTWRQGRTIVELVDKEGVRKLFEGNTPTEALLLALKAQWKGEL